MHDVFARINFLGHFLGLSGLASIQCRILIFTTVFVMHSSLRSHCGSLVELNVKQCQAAVDPQTKPTDLGSQSFYRLLLPNPPLPFVF